MVQSLASCPEVAFAKHGYGHLHLHARDFGCAAEVIESWLLADGHNVQTHVGDLVLSEAMEEQLPTASSFSQDQSS